MMTNRSLTAPTTSSAGSGRGRPGWIPATNILPPRLAACPEARGPGRRRRRPHRGRLGMRGRVRADHARAGPVRHCGPARQRGYSRTCPADGRALRSARTRPRRAVAGDHGLVGRPGRPARGRSQTCWAPTTRRCSPAPSPTTTWPARAPPPAGARRARQWTWTSGAAASWPDEAGEPDAIITQIPYLPGEERSATDALATIDDISARLATRPDRRGARPGRRPGAAPCPRTHRPSGSVPS